MKTIQEYLKNADVGRLVQEYFQTHPIKYESIADGMNLTVGQIRAVEEKRLTEYIRRLQSLEIMPWESGKEYILFAHKRVETGTEYTAYSLVCKQELLEKGTEAETYAYVYSRQSEIMGYMVSEAEFTQRNIYGLMADVLFESSFFGYQVTPEDLFEKETEEKDEIEERLHREFSDAETNYNCYCLKKEMAILKRLLLGATKEDLADFVFYDDIKYVRLEERYRGSFLPTFDDEAEMWVVDTEHGVEFGDVAYVAGEFCGDNGVYLFNNVNMPDPQMPNHGHEFESVICSLIRNPEGFSVANFQDCYAAQELRILHNLQEALLTVKDRNYPLSREEMRRNRERWEKAFSV